MDRGLMEDLVRWERGELSLDALVVAHGPRARALAELHARVAALGAGPLPSPDDAWAELAPRLPRAGVVVPLLARRVPRALVAAAAAAALVIAAGLAATRPIRHDLVSFLERVGAAFGLGDGRPDARTAGLGPIGGAAPRAPADPQASGRPVPARDEASDEAREGPVRGDRGAGSGPSEEIAGAPVAEGDADADERAEEGVVEDGSGRHDADEELSSTPDDGSGGEDGPDEEPEEEGSDG